MQITDPQKLIDTYKALLEAHPEVAKTLMNDEGKYLYFTVINPLSTPDEKVSAKTFEFRTGFSASPDAWHSLKVWHTGTEMKASLDGQTASQEVAMPAVFMNTAIMGGSPRNETAFFTGKVRKLVIDHAAEP